MWYDTMLQGGLAALKQGAGFIAAQQQAKAERQWQKWRNSMVNLQNAQNQNAITTNENIARRKSAELAYSIDRQSYQTSASAKVAAAAMGTSGRSVDAVVFDIERTADERQQQRIDQFEIQHVAFDQQREQSNTSAYLSQDFIPPKAPNAGTYMLGFGIDMLNIYNDQQKFERGLLKK